MPGHRAWGRQRPPTRQRGEPWRSNFTSHAARGWQLHCPSTKRSIGIKTSQQLGLGKVTPPSSDKASLRGHTPLAEQFACSPHSGVTTGSQNSLAMGPGGSSAPPSSDTETAGGRKPASSSTPTHQNGLRPGHCAACGSPPPPPKPKSRASWSRTLAQSSWCGEGSPSIAANSWSPIQQRAHKYMKRFSTSLIIREMRIKTTTRYHFSSDTVAISKETKK